MKPSTNVRIVDRRLPEEHDRPFLPGTAKTWLLPFYDLMSRMAGIRTLHERAVERAGISSGQTVVDVGCGTGNLSFVVLARHPDARVTGLDPDGDALRKAARKARRRSTSLTLVQGYADRIPAEDGSVDHVMSALALHHVDDEGRVGFAKDALRVLRPGGRVTVVDFAPARDQNPGHGAGHGQGHALRHLSHLLRSRVSRGAAMAEHLSQDLPSLLRDAGFGDAREIEHLDHRSGRIAIVQATRP